MMSEDTIFAILDLLVNSKDRFGNNTAVEFKGKCNIIVLLTPNVKNNLPSIGYVVTHFWVPTKNKKIQKKNIKKTLRRNPKNNRSKKRMLEC